MEVDPAPLAKVLEFEIQNVTLEKVTVFNDRAELTRKLSTNFPEGLIEVRIKNLSDRFNSDTLRVNGSEKFLIHEVQIKEIPVLQKELETAKVSTIRKIYEEKILKHRECLIKEQILQKRIESLDSLMTSFGKKDMASILETGNFERIGKLHEYYEKESKELREKHALAVDLSRQAKLYMEKAKSELNSTTTEYDISKNSVKKMNIIVIVLDSPGGAQDLFLSYQDYNANWKPSYDFRVDTASTPPNIEIHYFGKVIQCTGEDWQHVPLTLSTANTRGDVHFPTLRSLEVRLMNKRERRQWRREKRSRSRSRNREASRSRSRSRSKEARHTLAEEIEEKLLFSEFKIGKPANISGTGDAHKVTIGIFNVEPILCFQCAPKMDPSVYLTAYVCNNSKLTMLAGMASIFLNKSFITKTFIKHISQGEKFMIPLGLDPSIKVTNLPVKSFKDENGIMYKTNQTETQRAIEIKNNRKEIVSLTVKEQIPRSIENHVKVHLKQPKEYTVETTSTISSNEAPREGAILNNLNVLEWTITLQPKEKLNLIVEYVIEHPLNEKIYLSEA